MLSDVPQASPADAPGSSGGPASAGRIGPGTSIAGLSAGASSLLRFRWKPPCQPFAVRYNQLFAKESQLLEMRKNLDLEPACPLGPVAPPPRALRGPDQNDPQTSLPATETTLGRKGHLCFFSRKLILTFPSSGEDADGRFCPAERQCDAGWTLKASRR